MGDPEKVRVGFVLAGQSGDAWLGGSNYFKNLFRAVSTLNKPKVEIVPIKLWREPEIAYAASFESIKTSLVEKKTLPWLLRYGVRAISSRDWLFESLLSHHKVRALSHSTDLGKGSSVATVGWIPDFQHLHLPHLFSKKELNRRDTHYKRLSEHCDAIILSSNCAKSDFESFSPRYARKSRVLQFVSSPEQPTEILDLPTLQTRYSFTEPYFILPNQFWTHKNHRLVISALGLLKRQKRRALILATGNTVDPRAPEHFQSLLRLAGELDVLDQFRVLGPIPQSDLSSLMVHSIAFINPSLFEGWSTSVEEAKSLGKRILLSDIPVHREQCPPLGAFFDSANPEELARELIRASDEYDHAVDKQNQADAAQNLLRRRHAFGNTYQEIVLGAIEAK
jgi:glycosyltransferase involved in cell wall biosynthesis